MSVEEHFAEIIERTFCPFARPAKVAYGPTWEKEKSFEVNVDEISKSLARFCGHAAQDRFHGFVAEIYLTPAQRTFDATRQLFANFLRSLSWRDPAGSDCMLQDIGRRGWQFEYARTRLFANVFAPCYEEWHPKRSYLPDYAFFFFQPEVAFDYCGINRDQRAEKEAIRERFRRGGRPYNGDLIERRIEAVLYMSPLQLADPPVRWWEDLK